MDERSGDTYGVCDVCDHEPPPRPLSLFAVPVALMAGLVGMVLLGIALGVCGAAAYKTFLWITG